MDKLHAMLAFTRVVALGSYAAAGRELGLTRSAVSKGVIQLEKALGARLLDRTTRQVRATEAGVAYYERCLAILAEISDTEQQVSRLHDEPTGTLRLNAPMSFGVLHVGQAVAEFLTLYPDLKVELFFNDRFIDPVEDGFDVTIRIADLADSSLIARKLAPARRVLVAAPDYVSRSGLPQTPNCLSSHACLNYGHTTLLQRWQLTSDGKTMSVPINARVCSNNGDALRDAALAGHGIAMLPTFLVGNDIEAGRLQVVLAQNPPTVLGIYALYAPHKYLAAKTRVLIDFLVDRFGPEPPWDGFLNS